MATIALWSSAGSSRRRSAWSVTSGAGGGGVGGAPGVRGSRVARNAAQSLRNTLMEMPAALRSACNTASTSVSNRPAAYICGNSCLSTLGSVSGVALAARSSMVLYDIVFLDIISPIAATGHRHFGYRCAQRVGVELEEP